MHAEQDLLKAFAVVLGVSTITTVLSRRLRQPVVLGYIVAGLVIGPHVPLPLVADPGIVHTLSELGVTLLMFSLGLEFSLQKLARVGKGVAFTGLLQCSALLWLGFVTGRAFGWSTTECVFTGAIIAISSTTIIAKAFDEQRITGKLRDFVVGILIVEDLVAVLLLAAFTAFATGAGVSATELGRTAGRLGAFLLGLIVVGMLVVPRAIRYVVKLGHAEAIIITSIGLCFVTALLAREMGYSVALGSFIAGSLVAESGESRTVASLVEPVRDVFAAVFFVSVGMLIDPAAIAEHWRAVLALTTVVVVAKAFMVALGSFISGNGTRTSIRAGMSLAQIGEFSFIIASLGVTLKVTGAFLYTVAVAVSAVTTLLTPWLIRASDPFARWVDRKLPHSLQTFASLYGSWLERLGSATDHKSHGRTIRRLVRLIIVDASALAAIIVVTALRRDSIVLWLVGEGVPAALAWALVAGAAFTIALPFIVGILRVGTRLGRTLAEAAFPRADEKEVDLAAAPRRALVVTLQLALVLLVGTPLMAVTQPFLPGLQGAFVLLLFVTLLGVLFWRTTLNLEGHVRAGAQVIVEALASQSRPSGAAVEAPPKIGAILEGLGEPVAITIPPGSAVIGKTLADLAFRGQTGATVLAITREGQATVIPTAGERLREGDVLAVAGTREAVAAAKELLEAPAGGDGGEPAVEGAT